MLRRNIYPYAMKLKAYFIIVMFIPIHAAAQYEQKMSVTIEAGAFKTFGYRFGDVEPMQMPNYGVGLSATGGMQFRINERFSLSAEFGIMVAESWSYVDDDGNSYFDWSIRDSITDEEIASGYNYLNLRNFSLGLTPKYYLTQGSKWSPYLSLGVNINLTTAYFEDQGWMELEKRGLLPPDDQGPIDGFLEQNIGIGLNPGLGVEYKLNEQLHFYLYSGYYFIALNGENFKIPTRQEHFHALLLQLGTRIYLIKTKDL